MPGHAAVVLRPAEPKGRMADLIRVLPASGPSRPPKPTRISSEEWLVTNGLGGYASGTVSGAITRRYHGLLIAALPNPLGRMMMLNGLSERLRLPDRRVVYTGAEELAAVAPEHHAAGWRNFGWRRACRCGATRWTGFVLEKRLLMPYRQNTVHITYRLLAGSGKSAAGAAARRFTSGRTMRRSASAAASKYVLTVCDDQFEISGRARICRRCGCWFAGRPSAFTFDRKETESIPYSTERNRGYEWEGSLWSPGYFRADLGEGDRDHADRLHRKLGDRAGADARTTPCRRSWSAAAAAGAAADPQHGRARRRSWCWPPISF